MKKVLIWLMFFVVLVMVSCSEKSKMTGLCEKGDDLACKWVDKNNLCKGGEGGNPAACSWINNKKECDGGSRSHCFDLAVSLYNERLLDLSREYFKKSLLLYSQEERVNILSNFIEENKANFEVENLMYFWDIGCDVGYGLHCSQLFDILKERGLSTDNARLISLAEKGCKANFCQSCLKMGYIYGNGKFGIAEDMKKALEFYEKGCDSCYERVESNVVFHAKIYSCQIAGLLHFKGEKFGIPKNIEQSLKYYKIAYGIDNKDKEYHQQILDQMIDVTCGNGTIDEGELCDGGSKKASDISKDLSGTLECINCRQWACPDSNKFCFIKKNLKWSNASRNVKWPKAMEYCKEIGGRLPSISELRTLIQNCPATETGGDCGVTDSCLSGNCLNDPCKGCEDDDSLTSKYSVFGDTYYYWSSSITSNRTEGAWTVNFEDGSVNDYYKDGEKEGDVRCVK